MESQGVPGRIQITRATYEILRDGFLCEPRGSIEVKGKGPMETWFLEGGGRGTPAVSPVGCSVYQTWVRGPTALARICSSNVASPKAVNREVLDNELPRFSIPPSTSSMRRVAHHAAITALAPGGLPSSRHPESSSMVTARLTSLGAIPPGLATEPGHRGRRE